MAKKKDQDANIKPSSDDVHVEEKNSKEEISQKDEVEKLKKELSEKNDILLRTIAEYDNFRKRSQREKETFFLETKADLLSCFLPVLDNFERAADNTAVETEDYKKGIDMIFCQFNETLSKIGLEKYCEVGDKFDPQIHNGVMHIEDDNLGESVIVEVFQKGYRIGDRIIRAATVKVAN